MKILITEKQRKIIIENVHPMDVSGNIEGVKSICDGKRGVSWVSNVSSVDANQIADMIHDYDLSSIRVPSNPYLAFIIFHKEYEKEARELLEIAEIYNGYLDAMASDEDTRRIGQLLEYNPEEVEIFIKRMNKRKKDNGYT